MSETAFITETFGNPNADNLLLQMVDDHDLKLIEQEIDHIRHLSGGQDFCLKTIKVNSWNQDLSPWPAPAVFGRNAKRSFELAQSREGLPRSEIGGSFGNEDFGDGATETLEYLRQNVIPEYAESGVRPASWYFEWEHLINDWIRPDSKPEELLPAALTGMMFEKAD